MTIATTSTFNLDLEGVIRVAMRKAGILGPEDRPSPEDVAAYAEMANVELISWSLKGRFLRQAERETVALTPGVATVTLGSDTLDIDFPAYLALTSGSDVNYLVSPMSRSDYMMLSNKEIQSIPSLALVERGTTVTMTLWPVPDTTVASISFVRARFIKDFLPGTNPDIHARYLKALIAFLAAEIAENLGKDDPKVMRLEARAQAAMREVHHDNVQRGVLRFKL